MTVSRRCLEELHLLNCSLLPGELLVLTEDTTRWTELISSYALDPDCDLPAVGGSESEAGSPRFQVRLESSSDVWFDVDLPADYGEGRRQMPCVAVKGDRLGRDQQERWQGIVADALGVVQDSDSEYPLYDLISTFLLPELHRCLETEPAGNTSTMHADGAPSMDGGDAASATTAQTEPKHERQRLPPSTRYHALFVSHHLKSPQKRRSLDQWAHELSLSGFAKVGYPGVIYCDGAQEDVEDFVGRVKSMQWLALRLRFIEPAPSSNDVPPRRWTEFEKVGEVVEEMRRLGRESYVVEMGIGSAGNASAAK